jgi:outer membrane receptor protein involved in Fe transport
MRISTLYASAAPFALGLSLLAQPVLAQDQEPVTDDPVDVAPLPEDTVDTGPIIVTGSRIARPDFRTPSPVFSIGADALEEAGTTNLTDFLTGYPALVGSSTRADNSGSGAGIGATGLNLLNLRNLGISRTLVLVDGRRHVAGLPGDQAIDINTIPNELIERIDVLTGGVSAVYGADAVSGVVNFIMKKDFEGLAADAQFGTSEKGDAEQYYAAITAGTNFADGRGNFAVAYNYGREERLETRDRSYLSGENAVGFYRNPDDPENFDGSLGPDNGIPDYVPLSNVRFFDTNREGGIDTDFDGFPDYFVNGAGQVTAYDPGNFVPNFYQQGGNGTLASDYGNDLVPQVERHVVNALMHYDFSPGFTLFGEAKYAKVKSFSLAQPTFDYYLFIEPDNAFIPSELRDTLIENEGAMLNRDNFDFGQRGENIDRETIRSVIGARGDISDNLKYEVSYVFGQTKVVNKYVNDIYDDRFYAALDAVDEGQYLTGTANGNIVCRASLDPDWFPNQPFVTFFSDPPIRQLFAPTTFNPSECVPLNLFGDGAPSQEALDFIRTDVTDRSKITQHVVSALLSGDTGSFELPGGPIGFAVGAEYRKEKSSYISDPIARQGLTYTNAINPTQASFDVKEVFGEIRLPILDGAPLADRLEVGGAVRFSDYSTIGSTTTWKVDGAWAPVPDITFTGSYSQAVRAPNIGELFDGGGDSFEFITDPCIETEIQNGTENRAANCAAVLSALGVADPANFTDPRSTNILGFQGGNPDLNEETAKTWTVGAIVQPAAIPGLRLRADWYDIKIKNAVNFVTPEEAAQLCVDEASLDNQFCDLIVRSSDPETLGLIVYFTVVPQNVAQFRTAGLDVNLSYTLRTDSAGTFSLQMIGNYLDRLEFVGTPGAPITDSRGEAFAPKYQATADLSWSKGPVKLNYGLSWFDKTSRFGNQETAGNPDIADKKYLFYKARWQHDFYASFDVLDEVTVYGGVNNFTDEKPSIGDSGYPVDAVGRYFYAGIKVGFDQLGF